MTKLKLIKKPGTISQKYPKLNGDEKSPLLVTEPSEAQKLPKKMSDKIVKRGEIYWIHLPLLKKEKKNNEIAQSHHDLLGSQLGVVISSDHHNISNPFLTILPFTFALGSVFPGEILIELNEEKYKILTNQITTIDKKRLCEKRGQLSKELMKQITKSLLSVLVLVEPTKEK